MPLFGPNIEKMKEKRDVNGLVRALSDAKVRSEAIKALVELKCVEELIKALNSDNAEVRIEVAETLKEIGDPYVLEVLNEHLTNTLEFYGSKHHLRFNEIKQLIEVIIIIQGRAPENLLNLLFQDDPLRIKALKKVKKKMDLENFKKPLIIFIVECDNWLARWYATLALFELGDRDNEFLHAFIKASEEYLEYLTQSKGEAAVYAPMFGLVIHEETLRTLSHFKGDKVAIDAAVKAYEGKLLRIPGYTGRSKYAIYALVALGDHSTQKLLEDLVAKGVVPKIALDLYGKATYDEIKAQMESVWKK
jgi:hypothetical protein